MNRILFLVLRLFFHLLYHQFAWSYDLVAWIVSGGRWKSWILTSLPYLTGTRVLELGHGPGHLQLALHEKGLQVFGVDASSYMSRQAARRIRKRRRAGSPPANGLRLVCASALELPFASNSFDQVVATFPTEVIFKPETIQQIKRLLRPGGRLVVLPVAWITGERYFARLAAGLFRATGQAPEWDERLLLPFTRAGLTAVAFPVDLADSRVMIICAEKSLI